MWIFALVNSTTPSPDLRFARSGSTPPVQEGSLVTCSGEFLHFVQDDRAALRMTVEDGKQTPGKNTFQLRRISDNILDDFNMVMRMNFQKFMGAFYIQFPKKRMIEILIG